MQKWVWLAEKFQMGSVKTDEIIDYFGSAERVYETEDFSELHFLSNADLIKLRDKSLDAAYRIIESCLEKGYRIVTLDDEEYPAKLRDIPTRPLLLYVDGTLPDTDMTPSFAIVGTRNATPYGAKVASVLAMGIAQAGGIVTSGLAVGIDAFAHKGALKGDGKTIAVIGCGLDIPYPKANTQLKEIISDNGCVVSELPPGTKPTKYSFPVRNRIISGISEATIVVEAGIKSGSLITANHAAGQGRTVYAVPGNIDSSMSAGPNRLILDGARPLITVRQLIGENVHYYPHVLSASKIKNISLLEAGKQAEEELLSEIKRHQRPYEDTGRKKYENDSIEPQNKLQCCNDNAEEQHETVIPEGLTAVEEEMYRLICDSPRRLDTLAGLCHAPVYEVVSSASSLELKKLIELLPTGFFAKK